MVNFVIIDTPRIPSPYDQWLDSKENRNEVVEYLGREYRLIRKERPFSFSERVHRVALAIFAIVLSLGTVLISETIRLRFTQETIRHLFTKEKDLMTFGILSKGTSVEVPTSAAIVHAPAETLSHDVLQDCIFPFLTAEDLINCSKVNRKWRKCAAKPLHSKIVQAASEAAFGKEKWETYFCDEVDGEEPPFTEEMIEVLKSPSRHWNGKRVFQTHTPVLKPDIVRLPGTLPFVILDYFNFDQMTKNPKTGNPVEVGYGSLNDFVHDPSVYEFKRGTYWLLMPNDIIPKSIGKENRRGKKITYSTSLSPSRISYLSGLMNYAAGNSQKKVEEVNQEKKWRVPQYWEEIIRRAVKYVGVGDLPKDSEYGAWGDSKTDSWCCNQNERAYCVFLSREKGYHIMEAYFNAYNLLGYKSGESRELSDGDHINFQCGFAFLREFR